MRKSEISTYVGNEKYTKLFDLDSKGIVLTKKKCQKSTYVGFWRRFVRHSFKNVRCLSDRGP